ncbi:MAG: hypothetical protein LH606_16720 [Cytophagaceae bacterium]|nr:hypothetical protein [Cytophagaceae bacterium]
MSPTLVGRRFGYTRIAAYEAVVPGSATYRSLVGQLNGLPSLPTVLAGERYYWPASANAALAASLKAYYPTTPVANLVSIDSLEAANTAQFMKDGTASDELNRSADFGKKIAAAVFDWAKTDGYDNATPFTLPVGPGLWVPTPPAFAPPAFPNWIKSRPIVTGSDEAADQGGPTTYSEDPASAYYAQAKELYDISQNLTADKRTAVLFWADNPDGKSFTGPGHVNSILLQVMNDKKPTLDEAAQAFAYVGITLTDATISVWKSKYNYFAMRPITYMRSVMNQPTWNTVIATPARTPGLSRCPRRGPDDGCPGTHHAVRSQLQIHR